MVLLKASETGKAQKFFANVFRLDPKDEDNYVAVGLAFLKKS